MGWLKFFSIIFIVFTLLNGTFALLYYITGPENISEFQSKNFVLDIINLFHFSVQTMTTVGYGAVHPTGIIAGVLASVEALIGLLSFALISGLIYGRFSKAQSEIKYSKNILITDIGGQQSLQVRIANNLSHDLYDIEAKVIMIHDGLNAQGDKVKRFKGLPLVINKISFLPVNWTLTHAIGEKSPLSNCSTKQLTENRVEFLVVVSYYDDTFSQLDQSKTSYLHSEVIYGGQWATVFSTDKNGNRIFDLDKLNDIIPI